MRCEQTAWVSNRCIPGLGVVNSIREKSENGKQQKPEFAALEGESS